MLELYIMALIKKIESIITDIFTQFASLTSNKLHHRLYFNIYHLSHIIYFITLFGIITINPQYLVVLETIIKYYISIFLILRFNPWTYKYINKEEGEFDRHVAFTAGFFLLLTTAINNIIHNYINKIREFIKIII